ncbi:sodium-dependent glucose transporter 1A-like [Ylistrum balloti]|uniref:sodium-dependent glucose transporter 1A-like n=1 Tax=Ylistrum balloti TaxID=509963 RepID=UPI002905C1AB|nr:sodium-dependent glucose transporter 1A-like [Ylistrum balloti]
MTKTHTADTEGHGEEDVPLREILDGVSPVSSGDKTSSPSFFHEVQWNKSTRFKLILSVCLSMVYFILGWSKSQIGPAFLDLMIISGANLEMGSWFMTSYFLGRLIGSTVGGYLYTRRNHYLLFAASVTVNGLILAAIPWCTYYKLMIAAHAFNGVFEGIMNLTLTSKAVSVWGPTARGRSYIQIMYAIFALSGIIAPVVTAPFLLSNSHKNPNITSLTNQSNSQNNHDMTVGTIEAISPKKDNMTSWTNDTMSDMGEYFLGYNDTMRKARIPEYHTSRLYVAYSISALITVSTSVPFIILFLKSKHSVILDAEIVKPVYIGNLKLLLKRLQFLNIGIFSAMFSVIGQTMGNFITVFCVQHLKWTKVSGAMMTSFYVFATLVGNIGGIFLVRFLKSHTILLSSTVTYTVGLIGLGICAHLYADVGIWLSVCIIGVPFGMIWPTFISWTNSYLIPVSGYVTSYLLVTAHVATMLHPLVISYLMEEVSLLWFSYLCVIEGCISIMSVIMMAIYTNISKVHKQKCPHS